MIISSECAKILYKLKIIFVSEYWIFYLHIYGNRRKTVTWLIENFNLTYLEKDYRKQYVLFKCDDVEMLYTLLKLRG